MKEGIVNIHGKEYKTVALRVNEFRASYAPKDGWGIVTTLISHDPDKVIVGAAITGPDGRIVASGLSEEFRKASQINSTSALENAETSAIGRCLAAFGFGGTEYASANEVENAIHQQQRPAPVTTTTTLPADAPAYPTPAAPATPAPATPQPAVSSGGQVVTCLGYYEPKSPKAPWSFKVAGFDKGDYLKSWDEEVVNCMKDSKHNMQAVELVEVQSKTRMWKDKEMTDHVVNKARLLTSNEAADENGDVPF